PLVTIAGYAMPEDGWAAFESAVELVFRRRGVKILHAIDLQQSKAPFAGDNWKVLNKQTFVAQLCLAMKPHQPLGFSYTAAREVYERRAREAGRPTGASPYVFGFQVILNWILNSAQIGKRVREEGVAFIIERGSKNNGGITAAYDFIAKNYRDLGNTLRGLTFVPKTHSRAIQMADLIAYYSYRRAMHLQGVPFDQHASVKLDPVIMVMLETCPHLCMVGDQFGWGANDWRVSVEQIPQPPPAGDFEVLAPD
ncbi:MAG: DUF3800 domain-containing protein, partial [Reyranella sp.]|nr:DUF3800 domain-containing protein [Reyranella sp.]